MHKSYAFCESRIREILVVTITFIVVVEVVAIVAVVV